MVKEWLAKSISLHLRVNASFLRNPVKRRKVEDIEWNNIFDTSELEILNLQDKDGLKRGVLVLLWVGNLRLFVKPLIVM